MTELLWKAVNLDLTSRGGLRWDIGTTVTHPSRIGMMRDVPATYLSLSTEPAETLIGRGWPCRLLRVEPIGEVIGSDKYPYKRCALSAKVVAEEEETWLVFGPLGKHVISLIERAGSLTENEIQELADDLTAAARDAAEDTAWVVTRTAARTARHAARNAAEEAAEDSTRYAVARYATRYATRHAVLSVARDAAGTLVVRDRISTEHYDLLTTPWRKVIGPVHPDDVPLVAP